MTTAAPAFDPSAVPVQRAATVLLVDDRPELEVLCLRRRAGSTFVGGMTVFPGGGIDDHDGDPAYETRVVGRGQADAAQRLETPDALAYWVAVARETLEEAGVLLACDAHGHPCAPEVAVRHRHDVDRGHRTLLEVLDEESLCIDAHAVYDIGRWITPVGPPRRYDTRFFVAQMPPGQEAIVDEVEAVHGEWRRPVDALAEWRTGGLVMLPPTVAWLRVLERYRCAEEVLAAARASSGPGLSPRVMGDDRGSFRVVLPDEVGWHEPDAREALAWVYEGVLRAPGWNTTRESEEQC